MATMLLNYVYYSPAGHVAEALKLARGFRAANPGLEVHMALTKRTTWELGTAVDWWAGVHPMDAERRSSRSRRSLRRMGLGGEGADQGG
jgi:hypothetical protein